MPKLLIASLTLTCALLSAGPATAMTCAEFNESGTAQSLEETTKTKPTEDQILNFKVALDKQQASSERTKAILAAYENGSFGRIMRESFIWTRMECLENPEKQMDDIAISKFNALIDAAEKKR